MRTVHTLGIGLSCLFVVAGCSSDDSGVPVQGKVAQSDVVSGDAGTLADGAPIHGGTSDVAASGDGSGGDVASDTLGAKDSVGVGDTVGANDTVGGSDAGNDGAGSDGAGSDGAGGKDTAASAKGCAAAASCTASCKGSKNPDCVAACIQAAPTAAQAEIQGLMTCLDLACVQGECKGGESGCLDACLKKNCFGEMLACLDDGEVGTATCSTALTCFDVCKNLDNPWECLGTCYNGLSAEAQAQMSDYGLCAANAAKANKKVDNMCLVELAICFTDGKKGTEPCHTIFDCMEACAAGGGNQDICGINCLGAMNAQAQEKFQAIGDCWEGPKGGSPQCQSAFLGCVAPAGSLPCSGVLKCAGTCVGGDDAKAPGCMFKCAHQGTSVGAKDYLAMISCDKNGTCADALVTCAKPAGTANCGDTFKCLGVCDDKNEQDSIGCLLDCLGVATPKGAAALVKVMVCDEACKKKCPGDSACKEACTKKDCSTDLAACIVN
jgi:hypothetical protein